MNFKELAAEAVKISLPFLGGAIGGPGGALAAKALASALGLSDGASTDDISTALRGMKGEHLVAMRALEADLAKAQLAADTSVALAQIDLNKEDTKSTSMFKSGWRPLAGWLAVSVGLGYPVFKAILPWAMTVAGVQGVPALPALDTGEALTVLGALLGFGGMRSFEKAKGKA